jgi:hypothetical protein
MLGRVADMADRAGIVALDMRGCIPGGAPAKQTMSVMSVRADLGVQTTGFQGSSIPQGGHGAFRHFERYMLPGAVYGIRARRRWGATHIQTQKRRLQRNKFISAGL